MNYTSIVLSILIISTNCFFTITWANRWGTDIPEDKFRCRPGRKEILASMIYDPNPNTLVGNRRLERAYNFTDTFIDFGIRILMWPAVFTGHCPDNKLARRRRDQGFGMERGLTIAHKEMWHRLLLKSKHEGCSPHNTTMMIFEDDAFISVEDAPNRTIEYLENMDVDILFLGYCYRVKKHNLDVHAPHCLHA